MGSPSRGIEYGIISPDGIVGFLPVLPVKVARVSHDEISPVCCPEHLADEQIDGVKICRPP